MDYQLRPEGQKETNCGMAQTAGTVQTPLCAGQRGAAGAVPESRGRRLGEPEKAPGDVQELILTILIPNKNSRECTPGYFYVKKWNQKKLEFSRLIWFNNERHLSIS